MKGKEKQKMRRFTALLLSLMLICAMSMTAFATDGSSTVNVSEGGQTTGESHSYKAYQIFTGDLFDGKLSNIKWGKNAEDPAIQSAIAVALGLSADAELADILAELDGVKDESDVANKLAAAIASNKGALGTGISVEDGTTNVDPGYYILIDETTNIGDGDSRGFALLQCLDGAIKITEKRGTVISEKKVKDVNDSEGYNPTGDAWGTSADYDIGDDVEFVLTGTVADKFDMFEKYEFVFHDTMSSGLSFNNDVSVTMDGATVDASHYTVVYPATDETFRVEFNHVEEIPGVKAGSVIEISYTAKLLDTAAIGSKGNENEMYLEYSNNPYTDDKGKTPGNTVIVFTYKVDINKVDGNDDALEGAGFTLYKIDNTYQSSDDKGYTYTVGNETVLYNKTVKTYTAGADTTFSFEGIDDGEYLLVETETPAGYNSIDPVPFTVSADHGEGADGKMTVTINGVTHDYSAVELDFSNGKFEGSTDTDTGTLSTNVVNKSGSLLPSTGGIGTTMFYIIGGILMVGACMMLFVRKIMTNEKR